jgi:transposase
MRDIDLFQLALGLVPPWMVADAKFDGDKKRLDIEIDFKTGGRFACPECGKADCPVHDTVKKTWRHLNFFQHQAFLHARVHRRTLPDASAACRPLRRRANRCRRAYGGVAVPD